MAKIALGLFVAFCDLVRFGLKVRRFKLMGSFPDPLVGILFILDFSDSAGLDVAGLRGLAARATNFMGLLFYFVAEFICGVFVNKDVLNVL